MARADIRGRRLRDIREMSRFWDAEDLIRNFEQEMERLERGLGHMVWDTHEHRVTTWLSPLPITPRFHADESDKEIVLRVQLPDVDRDSLRVGVDEKSIELFACSRDPVCRPYHLSLNVQGVLKPDSAEAKMTGDVFEIKVSKIRKRKVEIK